MRALLDRPALHPQEQFPLEQKPSLDELFGKKPKPPATGNDKAAASL